MTYTSQEEHDHFEGAAEQSALQEPMTNIEERLAEFDKEFCQRNELGHYEIAPIRVRDYTRNDPIKKTNTILKEDIKAFLAESMDQAIAEERERVREKIENAIKYINWSHSVGSHSDDSGGDSDVECTCKEDEARYKTEAYKNTLSYLSPLDKPLADNINDI